MNSFPVDPSPLLRNSHLEEISSYFSERRKEGPLSLHYKKLLAHRYNLLISKDDRVLEVGCGEGELLSRIHAESKVGIDMSVPQIERGKARHPELDLRVGTGETLSLKGETFDVIIVSDTLNDASDVEMFLRRLHGCAHPGTRLVINIHNTLWMPLLGIGKIFGLVERRPVSSWLSRQDVINLCTLADWEIFKSFGQILMPLPFGPLSNAINRWLAPLMNWACLSIFLLGRNRSPERRIPKKVSVVVPARNEAGSIASAVARVPRLGEETELIFIEGHSRDNTWEVISALPDTFANGTIIKMKQTGKGKGNAVMEAFRVASGEIVTILDADLTMPPEELPKFIEVLASGKADFANGVRLVYPMDKEAMKFANLCANKGFSLIFSWLLGQPVKDTLCGTKALWREDYEKIDRNRNYFGDFDPFGDFDLLFGADKLNLKIMDIPVRYRERFYGETNIQRWKHGCILLHMVMFAARKLKFV